MSITIIKRQCQTKSNNQVTNRYSWKMNVVVDVKGWEMMKVMMPHISNTLKLNVILDHMFNDDFDMSKTVPDFFFKIMNRDGRGSERKMTSIQFNVDGTNFDKFDKFMTDNNKEVDTMDVVRLFIVNITNCFADPIQCGFLLDELKRVLCK